MYKRWFIAVLSSQDAHESRARRSPAVLVRDTTSWPRRQAPYLCSGPFQRGGKGAKGARCREYTHRRSHRPGVRPCTPTQRTPRHVARRRPWLRPCETSFVHDLVSSQASWAILLIHSIASRRGPCVVGEKRNAVVLFPVPGTPPSKQVFQRTRIVLPCARACL